MLIFSALHGSLAQSATLEPKEETPRFPQGGKEGASLSQGAMADFFEQIQYFYCRTCVEIGLDRILSRGSPDYGCLFTVLPSASENYRTKHEGREQRNFCEEQFSVNRAILRMLKERVSLSLDLLVYIVHSADFRLDAWMNRASGCCPKVYLQSVSEMLHFTPNLRSGTSDCLMTGTLAAG